MNARNARARRILRAGPALLLAAFVHAQGGCDSGSTQTPGADLSVTPGADLSVTPPADLTMAGCKMDSQCQAPTPFCDVGSGKCVACTIDTQCPEAQVCVDKQCVPGCNMNKGCGDAGMCANGQCTVCKTDGDCSMANPRCDTKTGVCVPCLPTNDNCPQGTFCVELMGKYSCNPGCSNDTQCRGVDGGGGAMAFACCKNTCIDTASDPQNCGACGNACPNGNVCCSGKCIDTTADVKNCGACGAACAGANGVMACETSKCVLKSCTAPFADCDKLQDNGCEVNTDTDPMNCLGCGTTCAVANGKAGCNKGCNIASCDPGFADCDKQLANGCEVSTDTDAKNCGACGTACANAPNANSTCSAGKCAIAACNGTFLDCDMTFANGCEVDGAKDAKNCSKCGMACPAVANGVAGCSGGTCGIASCTAPFADCDKNPANGCEVDTSKSAANCGACGKVCPTPANATAACNAGACGVGACNAGFGDCNMSANDGCEVNLNTDVNNCKFCTVKCAGNAQNSPTCTMGVCGLVPCAPPFLDCNGNAGDGCETNTSNNAMNCGACGKVCAAVANGAAGCAGGVCGIASCNAGFGNCDNMLANGCEVNLQTAVANCGACGKACAAVANGAATCANGVCGGTCNMGFADCANGLADGCEVNTTNNVNNCGGCNMKCAVANGVAGCAASVCTVASCNAGFADCKNGYSDGCETSTNTDINNCGACAKVCAAVANGTPGCANGVCGVASCTAPFQNCDNNAANGCEVNTSNDPKNCGGCGVVCPAGVCFNGSCKEAVLIVGSPSTDTWNNDVKAKLDGTGAFRVVDIYNAKTGTPTVQQLQAYQAVLVYSDSTFSNATTLGDNLATYWDGGGRVVVATFANCTGYAIAGRWISGGYNLIATGAIQSPAEAAAITIAEPGSPLVTGVASLTATSGWKSAGALANGGVAVAKWGSGAPLIVRGVKNGRALAALNFYPPSSAVRADFWTGSGANILRNALQYKGYCNPIVQKGGALCPSGKAEWCDPAAPIVATSATQAKAACDTCYGISCFLETADCAGNGYGPKPAGQYVSGDAYYGYAAGCSGAAGRIWAISTSYTTYGRWAP